MTSDYGPERTRSSVREKMFQLLNSYFRTWETWTNFLDLLPQIQSGASGHLAFLNFDFLMGNWGSEKWFGFDSEDSVVNNHRSLMTSMRMIQVQRMNSSYPLAFFPTLLHLLKVLTAFQTETKRSQHWTAQSWAHFIWREHSAAQGRHMNSQHEDLLFA